MELKLEKFVKALEVTTNIHAQNLSPVIVRIADKDSGITTVFCCGYQAQVRCATSPSDLDRL